MFSLSTGGAGATTLLRLMREHKMRKRSFSTLAYLCLVRASKTQFKLDINCKLYPLTLRDAVCVCN